MSFLKTFSNSNWKYFNLTREPNFIDNIAGKSWAEVVLKTK